MAKLFPPVNKNDHIQGSTDAIIELVEFGDYQCPHCGMAFPVVKKPTKWTLSRKESVDNYVSASD